MLQVGEVKKGIDIGKTNGSRKYTWFIWQACADCGGKRWVRLVKGEPDSIRCLPCRAKLVGLSLKDRYLGEGNPAWKGGRYKRKNGYVFVKLYPDDFFYPMAKGDSYVAEHRLVVAKALGRNLHLWEIVHHKDNCPRDDNRYPETLQLVTDDRHKQITILESKITRLEKENGELKSRLRELR